MNAQRDFFADPDPAPPAVSITETDRQLAVERLAAFAHDRIVALALERKDRLEVPGVVAEDVTALVQGRSDLVLLGDGQRAMSWVGPWLKALVRAGDLVVYRIAGMTVKRHCPRNRNDQVVYLHPTDFRAGGRDGSR